MHRDASLLGGPRWAASCTWVRRSPVMAALVAALSLCASCSAAPSECPPVRTIVRREPGETETRQLRDARLLMIDLAGERACDALRGRILTLGATRDGAPFEGRIWLHRCEGRVERDRLALELGAWAWAWIDQSSRVAGATFEVRQYVHLEARTTLVAVPELRYDRESRWAYVWLRPVEEPEVRTRHVGPVDADPEGAFSHVVGVFARIFSDSPDELAHAEVSEEGDRRFEAQVDSGFTIYADLCTSEAGMETGRLRRPPHPRVGPGEPGPVTPVRVHPGGLDVHGPIAGGDQEMIVRMKVSDGGPSRGRLVCEREMERLLRAFHRGAALPAVRALDDVEIRAGVRRELRGGGGRSCPLYLVTTPASASPSTVRFTIQPAEDDREALVACRAPRRSRGEVATAPVRERAAARAR
jgi:hypothetical protein